MKWCMGLNLAPIGAISIEFNKGHIRNEQATIKITLKINAPKLSTAGKEKNK